MFDLGDESVKRAWSELCADLVGVGIPSLWHVLSAPVSGSGERSGPRTSGLVGEAKSREEEAGKKEEEVKSLLWMVLARTYQNGEGNWEDLVSFLAIPFSGCVFLSLLLPYIVWILIRLEFYDRHWEMLDDGYELWDAVLRSAFTLAGVKDIRPGVVIQLLVQHAGPTNHNRVEMFVCPLLILQHSADEVAQDSAPARDTSSPSFRTSTCQAA